MYFKTKYCSDEETGEPIYKIDYYTCIFDPDWKISKDLPIINQMDFYKTKYWRTKDLPSERDKYDKRDYTYYSDLTCEKCKKKFTPVDFQCYEYGTRYFPWTSSSGYLCEFCYDYLPKPDICLSCKQVFNSRNKLFNHLKNKPLHLQYI